MPRQIDRLGGVVRARPGQNRHAAPGFIDADVHQVLMLVCDRVGLSPVVPPGTSPWLPLSICQSTSSRSDPSSTSPSLNGVTSAVIEPLNGTFITLSSRTEMARLPGAAQSAPQLNGWL